jgi:hypothetical protein
LQALLEGASNGHRFAGTFHLHGERGGGLREFLEGKARNLLHAGLVLCGMSVLFQNTCAKRTIVENAERDEN